MTRKDFEYHLGAFARLMHESTKQPTLFGAPDYVRLEKLATRMRAILTRECNGYPDTDWDCKQKARDERASLQIERAARCICDSQLGLPLHIQGDPRGPSFIIGDPNNGVRL